MKKYEVTITAIVTKTIIVEADDEYTAEELAHEEFNILNDDVPEHYAQETITIKEH